jgi:predicted site-specific integrase-resolvase
MLITVKKAAEIAQVHQNTIRRWLYTGLLKGTKIPTSGNKQTRWRIDENKLNDLLHSIPCFKDTEE